MTITVTGHRPERLNGKEELVRAWIREQLIKYHPEEVINGMAKGTDQIAAEEAENLGIPVVCVYAIKPKSYSATEKRIVDKAAKVEFMFDSFGGHGKASYVIRDKRMVDEGEMLLAVFDGVREGGTWDTIEYALKKGTPIVFFPEEKLK